MKKIETEAEFIEHVLALPSPEVSVWDLLASTCGPAKTVWVKRVGDVKPTEKEIDHAIEEWHWSFSGMTLHEWLGWTWHEYAEWVRDPDAVPDRPLRRD